MDLQELIEHFRTQVQDEDAPYLWTDDELLLYAVDAQDQFVRALGGISDMTVPAADVGSPAARLADLEVAAGDPWALISPYVLRVRSARLVTAKVDIPMISEADMAVVPVRDYGWTRGMALDDSDTGDVRFGVLGLRDNYVRWIRVPVEADTCRLHVYRLPYPRIAAQESALEIGEEHHIHLVKWMKHMAYSKEDAETYDKGLADKNKALFEEYCEKGRKENERRRFKPRTVQMSCPGYN